MKRIGGPATITQNDQIKFEHVGSYDVFETSPFVFLGMAREGQEELYL